MSKFWFLLLLTFCLYDCVPSELSSEQVCDKSIVSSRSLKVSAKSRKNESIQWEDTITALAESSHASALEDVDLTHKVLQCDGKKSIFIQAVSKAPKYTSVTEGVTEGVTEEKLHFHARCGKNAVIMENGRSAKKINKDDYYNSQLFTHRPLRDNELFEVKLDEKNEKNTFCLVAIGIITRSPESVEIIPQMYKSPDAFIYMNTDVNRNGTTRHDNYGKNIDYLKVGDRVGVMRNKFGTLHFFVNGEDQGPAISSIPSSVYGVVEMWGSPNKVSIVSPS